MRTPSQAIAEILERIAPLEERESVPLAQARGRVLAASVTSDVDLPPFEKSAMDGFAVRASSLPGADAVALRCVGESRAGEPFAGEVPADACVEIYTGAELPATLDAVVMVEHSRREGETVWLEGGARAGQHVNHKGEVLAVGREVLRPGRRLSALDLSVLAAVGCDPVPVLRRPRVSILTTGDELVPADQTPGAGQIREGNTLYLAGAAEALGLELLEVGIVPDEESELRARFGRALEQGDVLITTGGVSMGKYDLVGAAFEALGVEPVLHKVAIKPGKPIWFGLAGEKPVFGLPGNPVSAMLGWAVFAKPAIEKRMGLDPLPDTSEESLRRGRWRGPSVGSHWRQQNLPVTVTQSAAGEDELWPLDWRGSADVVALTGAQAFAVVDAETTLSEGEWARYRPLL